MVRKAKKILIDVIGPTEAGKSSFIHQLTVGDVFPYVPTVGTLVHKTKLFSKQFQFIEIGGASFSLVTKNPADAFVLVVDCGNTERYDMAKRQLQLVTQFDSAAPVLVLANKCEMNNLIPPITLMEALNLDSQLRGRPWRILPSSCTTGDGCQEAVQWLHDTIMERRSQKKDEILADEVPDVVPLPPDVPSVDQKPFSDSSPTSGTAESNLVRDLSVELN